MSGSTSKLSLKEIPKALRGRTLNKKVFPLSFKEFLKFKNIELEKDFYYSEKKLNKIKNQLREYLEYGGFPEVVLEDEEQNKKRLIQEYFRTIVALDLGEKYNIKNLELLSDLLKLMLNSTMFSHNKMYNILKSMGKKVGKESMVNYVKKSQEIFFSYLLPIFSYKIKDQMQYPKKLYFNDNGFINYVGLKFSEDLGRLLENVVAIELKRRGKEIYYWSDRKKREVDFVIKEGTEIKQLIQVCYNLNEETKDREIKSILKASKDLSCKDLTIITWDQEKRKKIEGKTIQMVPIWKWILS